MLPLILASSSPYRRDLLARLALPFTCESPAIDETPRPDEPAPELVRRLAREKARAVASRHSAGRLIIASDQVATRNGTILTKPGTPERAARQLRDCSDREVTFFTALTLLNSDTGSQQEAVAITEVLFRPLDDAQIARYVEREKPLDCAGSFKAEGLGISLFRRIRGDDPNSLIGLPLIQLVSFLNNEGIAIP